MNMIVIIPHLCRAPTLSSAAPTATPAPRSHPAVFSGGGAGGSVPFGSFNQTSSGKLPLPGSTYAPQVAGAGTQPDAEREDIGTTYSNVSETDFSGVASIGEHKPAAKGTAMSAYQAEGAVGTVSSPPTEAPMAVMPGEYFAKPEREDEEEPSHYTRAALAETADGAAERAREAMSYPTLTSSQTGGSVYDTAAEYGAPAKNTAVNEDQTAKDIVASYTQPAADTASGYAQAAKETVISYTQPAADTASGYAQAAKDTVVSYTQPVVESISNAAQGAKETLSGAAETAQETAASYTQPIAESASQATEQLTGTAAGGAQAERESSAQGVEYISGPVSPYTGAGWLQS